MESNPLFNDMSVFEAIAEQVERAKTGTSIISRIKKNVKEGLIESLLPILVELVRYVNSEVDIEAIKQQYGFVEHAVFKIVLMDYDKSLEPYILFPSRYAKFCITPRMGISAYSITFTVLERSTSAVTG